MTLLLEGRSTRVLTVDDAEGVVRIIDSRNKIGSASDVHERDTFVQIMSNDRAYDPRSQTVLGLFENGELDAFHILRYPDARGFDGPRCAINAYTSTMGRAGRVKTEAGWDNNHTILCNAIVDHLIADKRWETWTLMPGAFRGHVDNPDMPSHALGWYEFVMPPLDIPAGELASGPDADFIRTYVASRTYPEVWSVRRMTIKEEFRT